MIRESLKYTKFVTLFLFSLLLFGTQNSFAHKNVVVVPLIGNGTELKPLPLSELIEKRIAFTYYSNQLIIGDVTATKGIMIKNIMVAPRQYPATRAPISLRFCRVGGGCSHAWPVPNDNVTVLDFGLGDRMFETPGRYYVDIPTRGGLPQTVANQIIVNVSGYYYDK